MPGGRLARHFLLLTLLLAWPQAGLSQSDEENARAQLQQLQRDIKRINREIASAGSQIGRAHV